MGLRFTSTEDRTALFDSVSGWAFGPTFATPEAAERFLDWCLGEGVKDGDLRPVPIPEIVTLWDRYCAETENPDE